MDNKETIKTNKKVPSRAKIAALGILGLTLAYTGASTDDAREAATPEQRTHIASPFTTLAMEGAGILCMVGAGVLLRKRQNQR